VLINLLSNAAEAMAEKLRSQEGFAPRIVVKTSLCDGQARIAVEDNGPGIAPENINRIREPLFTTKSFGVGLGIPAIIKILERHNGALDIESMPGCGAKMTARFPVRAQSASRVEAPAPHVIRLSAVR
jgi:signal transduction histidine kinase